ncbi:MAG: phytase [Fimbriimonadaceae bacterium]|nr:phytase [Fimbriimonadaceae bacterium]
MKRASLFLAGLLVLVGCSGNNVSPLANQPGDRTLGGGRSGGSGTATATIAKLAPAVVTDQVANDPDDPAIWINKEDSAKSLIFGTDKIEEKGALYVFGLDGKKITSIEGLDRPNNVDVEYDFAFGDKLVDIVVVTERKKKRLKIYSIDRATGELTDVTGSTDVSMGDLSEAGEPMGIGLYRHTNGTIYAIVSPKTGPKTGYLGQFRLEANGDKIDTKLVRRFGEFSGLDKEGNGEIEAIVVDDEMGFVYYSDELKGIRKYSADPDSKSGELALFGTDQYKGDREGLAIFSTGPGEGYLLSSDQVENGSRLFVYSRTATSDSDAKNKLIRIIETPADATDGIEATSIALGNQFPMGFVVMMDSKNKRFVIFDWRQISSQLGLSGR